MEFNQKLQEVPTMNGFGENKLMKAITFSFDDGTTQDIKLVELMNKYNLKGTFNLNSDLLGTRGMLKRECGKVAHYKIYPEDVRSVYEGHEVAVHTLTHPNLTTLGEKEIIRQVENDRVRLSELAGYEVIGMAYPCGGVNNDDRVAQIIKDNTGVKYSRTITLTNNFDRQENVYRYNANCHVLGFERMMEMGKKFIEMKPDKEQIFYIWGHAFEMDYSPENMVRLEEFFKLIAGKDDIFYGTNKEILI